MTDPPDGLVIQIASNDYPPFNDITSAYRLALQSLGREVQTIVLAPAVGEPDPQAVYLDLENSGATRSAARALRARVAGSEPVLAICHRYRPYRVLRAARLAAVPTVVVAHEFGFFRRVQRRIGRRLFARRVMFAGVSPSVQAELAEVVEDPLCLPNASRKAAEAELALPTCDALTIGLVGRLVHKKAPELAIRAIRELTDRGRTVRLLVIGDGPLRAELESLAADLPVVFCGFVPEARRLFRGLDVLLLTSVEVEAFGMVALEAMASGVPVVAGPAPGPQFVLGVVAGPAPGPQFVLGGTGYYYTERTPADVANALERLHDDLVAQRLAQRMDQAQTRVLREFSIAALARHLDELFYR
jgi:glycosyltransferase involved in cell wall biosynthesis